MKSLRRYALGYSDHFYKTDAFTSVMCMLRTEYKNYKAEKDIIELIEPVLNI